MRSDINAVIQARFGSSRLQGKVLNYLQDKRVIEHVIDRIKESKLINKVIITTTVNAEDDPIEEFCKVKIYLLSRK